MSDIEVRRVQRVGSSSLVVTLPKSWAKRLGLEQGSTVVLYEEGDSIRIVPAVRREMPAVSLDLSRMPPFISMSVPVCSYLTGMDKVEVILPDDVRVEDVKMRGLVFMGMHVYEAGSNRVIVETLLDMDRIDPDGFIKTLGTITTRLVGRMASALRNGGSSEELRLADFARHDFMRTLYVVLRSLFTRAPIRYSRKGLTLKLMSASYVSLAIEIVYTIIPLIPELSREAPARDREAVADALERLGSIMNELLHVIPKPSVKRLSDLLHEVHTLDEKLSESVKSASTPLAGAALGKVHDALRIITLASYITVCRILAEIAGREG